MMTPLSPQAGVVTLATKLAVGGNWAASNLVRFKDGLLQKLGGWACLTTATIRGTCRAIFAWSDLSGKSYISAGTTSNLQLYNAGQLYDITPIRRSADLTRPFTSVAGSSIIVVDDVGAAPLEGDAINIPSRVSIGGGCLQGWYSVGSAPTANQYNINSGSSALATSAAVGTLATYTTQASDPIVAVSLPAHGLISGMTFTVGVSTSVGGLTLEGDYTVRTVHTSSDFDFDAGADATGAASAIENGGDVRIDYAIAAQVSGSVRVWWFDNWGEDLMACPNEGSLYLWAPPIAKGNVATVIGTAPTYNTGFFIAMPAHIVVAFGSTDSLTAVQDKVLIRWSNVDDYTDWTATVTNQAGSYRLPSGSYIIGAVQAPMQAFIFTDIELWTMTYIGYPLVFSFQKVGWACGLLAPKAVARIGNALIWMGHKEFFIYDGAQVKALPCPVWDQVFPLLDKPNSAKCFAAVNSDFSEVSFFYPVQDTNPYAFGSRAYGEGAFGGKYQSPVATNNECSSYVKYNLRDGVWDYGVLARTAWMDQSVVGEPIGVDISGLLQQHEVSDNADGTAMQSSASTGWMKISNGGEFVFLERIIPDFFVSGTFSVGLTVSIADYPNDNVQTFGPYTVDASTQYVVVRARGRFVSLSLDLSALDSFVRMGQFLMIVQPSGRR